MEHKERMKICLKNNAGEKYKKVKKKYILKKKEKRIVKELY